MNASEGVFDDEAYELDAMNLSVQSPHLEMLSTEKVGIEFAQQMCRCSLLHTHKVSYAQDFISSSCSLSVIEIEVNSARCMVRECQ